MVVLRSFLTYDRTSSPVTKKKKIRMDTLSRPDYDESVLKILRILSGLCLPLYFWTHNRIELLPCSFLPQPFSLNLVRLCVYECVGSGHIKQKEKSFSHRFFSHAQTRLQISSKTVKETLRGNYTVGSWESLEVNFDFHELRLITFSKRKVRVH